MSEPWIVEASGFEAFCEELSMQTGAHPELGVNSMASVEVIRPVMSRKAK
jgi:hypothetical protein